MTVALVALAGLAGAAILWATPHGIGVDYDSYFYLEAAEGLGEGHGFGRSNASGEWQPLTHFPPLYPAAVTLTAQITGLEIPQAARGLAAVLQAATLLAAGLFLYSVCGIPSTGLIGAAVLAVSAPLAERYLWALSEGPFLPLLIGHIFALWKAIETGKSAWLAAAGLAGAGLYLTRYAGLPFLALGWLALMLLSTGTWFERAKRGAIYVLPAVPPILAWHARNALQAGSLTNRRLGFHPVELEKIRQAGRTLAGWIPWEPLPPELRVAVATVLMTALVIWGLRRVLLRTKSSSSEPRRAELGLFLAIQAGGYVLFLLISLTFLDASTRLGDRILAPVYLLLLLAATILASEWWPARGRVGRILALGMVCLTLILPNAIGLSRALVSARREGLGFQSLAWRQSATLGVIQALPPETLIYTNEAFPVEFLTGRQVFPIPERLDPVRAEERAEYLEQLSTMRLRLQEQDGILVLFNPTQLRVEMPSPEVLAEGLSLIGSYPDGQIYAPAADG